MAEAVVTDRVILTSIGPGSTILRPNFPLVDEDDFAELEPASLWAQDVVDLQQYFD